jgi:hypothetical protein
MFLLFDPENFIFDSRDFLKVFHLLLFNGSFIFFQNVSYFFCLILLLMIDLTSDKKGYTKFSNELVPVLNLK